ncbi:hypothetical protein DITRI_Ditri20bG0051500 [Diplodiscus trichospermus]
MDAPNILENVGVELARKKTKTRRISRWLSTKKLAVKWNKKEIQRIKKVHKLMFAVNRRMEKMIDDFLVAAEAENADSETAIWAEKAIREVIQGMNDLNLEGDNVNFTVNQVQSCCSSGSAANGDNK